MTPTKASDRDLLDELLGVPADSGDEEERTEVLDRPQAPREAREPEAPVAGARPVVHAGSPEGTSSSSRHRIADALAHRAPTPSPSPPLAGTIESTPPDEGRDAMLGALVGARYRVIRTLGVGGIGIVYLCQDESVGRPVALKMLRPEYVAHEDLNERFLIEARAASAIKSRRIVDTIDVGTLPNGAPYFVMEYVEGETLAALLEREGAVDLRQALEIARQVAEGLCAAHAAGVVHRDLKPENVFLARERDGAPFAKIFDFGIAKVSGARKRLTYVGAVFGTPTYMSPEQARGEPVDERADIYALGIMLFEMVAGAVPFDGEDPLAIMSQHVDRPAPALASMSPVPVPVALEAVVQRCLAKDAAARYPTAEALLQELSRVDPEGEKVPAAAPAPVLVPAPAQTLHTHVVTSHPAATKASSRWLWAVGALFVLGAGGAWAVLEGPLAGQFFPPAGLAAAPAERAGVTAGAAARGANVTPPEAQDSEVHFVVSPLDARVYRGDEDLGPMPVSLRVKKGEPVTVTVRRKGYSSRRVVVDGSQTRVVVGLVRLAEATPAVNRATPARKTAAARAATSASR